MCTMIVINNGEKEITTVKEFKEHFGVELPIPDNATDVVDDNCCLCQIDVESELKKLNLPYEWDCGDYYVAMA